MAAEVARDQMAALAAGGQGGVRRALRRGLRPGAELGAGAGLCPAGSAAVPVPCPRFPCPRALPAALRREKFGSGVGCVQQNGENLQITKPQLHWEGRRRVPCEVGFVLCFVLFFLLFLF